MHSNLKNTDCWALTSKILIHRPGVEPKIYISDEFLGVADAAGQGTIL